MSRSGRRAASVSAAASSWAGLRKAFIKQMASASIFSARSRCAIAASSSVASGAITAPSASTRSVTSKRRYRGTSGAGSSNCRSYMS